MIRRLVAVAALCLGGCTAEAVEMPPVIGELAPAYSAGALAGGEVSLADLRGEVVLLNVWATWCPPCREEMPGLERLHAELAAEGLAVTAVSIDKAPDRGKVEEFVRENGITFRVLLDPGERLTRTYRTSGVPETFLIGRDGTLLRRWIGQIDPASATIRDAVADALAERVEG
jgi:cytochrome c biogenesis protein CcmG, thiol:disulfide interchange protein DsbE